MVYVAILTESLAWGNFILETYNPAQLYSLHHSANSYAVSNEAANKNGAWGEGLVLTGIMPEKHFCEPVAIKGMFMSGGQFGGKLKIIFLYKSKKVSVFTSDQKEVKMHFIF